MSPYKLRPHHLLCIRFFEGKGYSNAFVNNMTSITKGLKENPLIELTMGYDDICKACPQCNDQKSGCFDKAHRYDEALCKACKLTVGISQPYEKLQQLVSMGVVKKGKLVEICGDCEWITICSSSNCRKLEEL